MVEARLAVGATAIRVTLHASGSDLIEVADDGCGVAPAEYAWQVSRSTSALAGSHCNESIWMLFIVAFTFVHLLLLPSAAIQALIHPPSSSSPGSPRISPLVPLPPLNSPAAFGFRANALSSLCAVADVTITTRSACEPCAAVLCFDGCGRLQLPAAAGGPQSVPQEGGTTVALRRLFGRLPVRRALLQSELQKEFAKLRAVLQVPMGAQLTHC